MRLWLAETTALLRAAVRKTTPDELEKLSSDLSGIVYGTPFGTVRHRAETKRLAVKKRAALLAFLKRKLKSLEGKQQGNKSGGIPRKITRRRSSAG